MIFLTPLSTKELLMNLSVKKLKSLNACTEAIQEYINYEKPKTVEETVDICIKSDNKTYLHYANWLLPRVMRRKSDKIKYAIYAALLVIKNYENEFPNNSAPRKAILAAKQYLKNPSAKNRSAAESAAERAAWSAESAAWGAAESAGRAAESAESAARSAVWSAAESAESAESAEYNKTLIKIITYGLKLL